MKTLLFFSKKIYVNSQTFVREQLRGMVREIPDDWRIVLVTAGGSKKLKSDYPWMESLEIVNPYLKKGQLFNMAKGALYVLRKGRFRALGIAYFKKIFYRYSLDVLLALPKAYVLHKQFASNVDILMKMKEIGLIRYDRLLVSCRGHDVSQAFKRNPHIYNAVYPGVDAFMPVSDSLGDQLRLHGCPSEKIRNISSGLQTKNIPFNPNHKERTLSLFSVGRLTEKKGHIYAIQAVDLLRREMPHIRLEIAGKGPDREILQALIREKGLEDHVFLLGALSHNQVLEKMRSTDIFLLHSVTSSTGDMEGIPNVLKEAMLSGALVVCSDHSGNKELLPLKEDHVLIPERDVAAMARRIKELWSRDEGWKNARRALYREYVINEFDSSRVMEKLLPLIVNKELVRETRVAYNSRGGKSGEYYPVAHSTVSPDYYRLP